MTPGIHEQQVAAHYPVRRLSGGEREASNAEILRLWLRMLSTERMVSQHTVDNYRRDVERYLDWLGPGMGLADVRSEQIEQHLVWLHDTVGLARSSSARALAAIRSLHDFAVQEGWVAMNVAQDVPVPAVGVSLPKALTVEQVIALLDAVPNGESASIIQIRDRALLEMLYSTGARISELLDLNLDDVDQERGLLIVRGKGGKERVVPVGKPALDALGAYMVRSRPTLNKLGNPALFVNNRGKRMGRQSGYKVVAEAAAAAGFRQGEEKISPHALRHSFATHLLEGGASVRVVQELMGHSSVATTQIYTKVTVDHLREAWAHSHPRV